jgi:hypothetical protein
MNTTYYPSFKYVDIGNAKSKWLRILLTDLEKYRSELGNADFCKSLACYSSQTPQSEELMLIGIIIDLDNDNLEVVLVEARSFRDYFYGSWGLRKEDVRFYYSGNRSIHIEIQPETLGISPHSRLYLYIRETVRTIADNLGLGSVDYSLYARRHLLRCVGAVHSKTNKYKIELDPSELNLSTEELYKLGDSNRGYLYKNEVVLSKNETAAKYFSEIFDVAKNTIDESDFRGSKIENLSVIRGMSKFPACVKDLFDNNIRMKGTRNRATLALITFFKDAGKTKAEILELLIPWAKAMPSDLTGADEQERITHIKSLIDYLFSETGKDFHFACQFILSLGNKDAPIECKPRCQLHFTKETHLNILNASTPKIIKPISYLPEVGNFLTELVWDPADNVSLFALYNTQSGEVKYVEEILFEYPIVYIPHIDENVLKGSVLLPSRTQEYGSEEDIYAEVSNFIDKYYNEPDKTCRALNTCYVFFSWVYDKFRSWCYLQFLGRAGGGKSRALEAIGHICYRPILLAGADTAACMLRMQDAYRGTGVMDEATFIERNEAHQAIVQMLNVGYKLNGSVGRCEGDENIQVRYIVASPKLLATRIEFFDDGLRSRCFVKRTGLDNRIKEGKLRQPFVLPDCFEDEARTIRNKLLLWRFRHWKNAKLNPEFEIKGVESRINEIVVPILSVMGASDSARRDIEALARQQQEDLKQQRQTSLEGEILRAIKNNEFTEGDIMPADIAKEINKDRERRPISTHAITSILKRMELELHKYGNRYMLTDSPKNRELLQQLFKDYDLNDAPPCIEVGDTDAEGEKDNTSVVSDD